jgi:hypothetical protein
MGSVNIMGSKEKQPMTTTAKKKETTHRRVQRVRRVLERSIAFCKANGIELETGVWMSDTSACAIGTLFHQQGLKESDVNRKENIDAFAARQLGISEKEVGALIGGFDSGLTTVEEEYDDDTDTWNEVTKTQFTGKTREDAFGRLGARLRVKHLYGAV